MSKRLAFLAATFLCILVEHAWGLSSTQDPRLLGPKPNEPGRRLALVIGNDGYRDGRLTNARKDARAVGETLRRLQFSVTLIEDATREQFARALEEFSGRLASNDLALLFYAGHGVSVGAENYLMPTDFSGGSESSIRISAVPVSLIAQLTSRAHISIVILDACRNNPFKGTRGGGGLVPMEIRGSLIAYATAAGETASDNIGAANGVFTTHLLRVLTQPGVGLRTVFQIVRQQVFEASGGLQFPAVYDNLLGDLVLVPGPVSFDEEGEAWKAALDANSITGYEAYLKEYPSGKYTSAARVKLAALRPDAVLLRSGSEPAPAAGDEGKKPVSAGRYVDKNGCLKEADGSFVIGFRSDCR